MKNIHVEQWVRNSIRFTRINDRWHASIEDVSAALCEPYCWEDFPDNEKASVNVCYANGELERMRVLSDIGVYRLIFQSEGIRVEAFKVWFVETMGKLRNRPEAKNNHEDVGAYALFEKERPSISRNTFGSEKYFIK